MWCGRTWRLTQSYESIVSSPTQNGSRTMQSCPCQCSGLDVGGRSSERMDDRRKSHVLHGGFGGILDASHNSVVLSRVAQMLVAFGKHNICKAVLKRMVV
jgi:hypothetical protein